ncbi:retron system putative HNH endonuclease [Serratia fonticola]|uniref:retron system putative HNH endonuclease n=1 Tax=Serratia fonticola TaxID=47917 RepID=UPI0021BB41DA|nr:retron system putative HNH endonuclease [Serratia fonticola]
MKAITEFSRGDASGRTKLKGRIKKHLEKEQGGYCYYCGCELKRFGKSGVHIDHILPKSAEHGRYQCFTFEPKNLVLACFRCNSFDYKYEKDYAIGYNKIYDLNCFKIVHPHLEDINDYITVDFTGVVESKSLSSKGRFMIDEFDLNCEELLSIRSGSLAVLAMNIRPSLRKEIDEILLREFPTGFVG